MLIDSLVRHKMKNNDDTSFWVFCRAALENGANMNKKNNNSDTLLMKKAATNKNSPSTKNNSKPYSLMVILKTTNKSDKLSDTAKKKKPDSPYSKTKSKNKCSTWTAKSSRLQIR